MWVVQETVSRATEMNNEKLHLSDENQERIFEWASRYVKSLILRFSH